MVSFAFAGTVYTAHFVPFGISPGPAVAVTLTAETNRIMAAKIGIPGTRIHTFVDDNFFYGKSREECNYRISKGRDAACKLGWSVPEDHIQYATKAMAFRGILVNSIEETLSIPHPRY